MNRGLYRIKENLNIKWVYLAVIFLSLLGFYANNFPPLTNWHILLFFILTGAVTYSLSQSVLNNVRRSGLLCIGFLFFLILRLLDLTHPVYIILLIASVLSVNSLFK